MTRTPTGPRLTSCVAGVVLVTAAATGLAACSSSASTSAAAPSLAASTSTTPAVTGTATVRVGTTPAGTVLVTSTGRTLYEFSADSAGRSTCTGSCAQYWPPVPAPTTPAAGSGVSATLGSLARADGTRQLTVNGYPVYTYAGDSASGQSSGQGLTASGGQWWVVGASGTRIVSGSGSASASPSASPSASTRGGY